MSTQWTEEKLVPAEGVDLADLLERIEADTWPTVPAVSEAGELLELHRQMLEAAELDDRFVHPAEVIYNLFRVLHRARTLLELTLTDDQWAATSAVVEHVIGSLRTRHEPTTAWNRLEVARGWLNQLAMQVDHLKHLSRKVS